MRIPPLVILSGVLLTALLSLHVGLRAYSPLEVYGALAGGEQDTASLIVRNQRLPRTILALIIGAALGLSGFLMQSVTRNPIAEPGILGVNAGAAFAVVLLVTSYPASGVYPMMAAAFCGAVATSLIVFGVAFATGGGLSPIHLLLAGVSIAALLGSGVQVLIIANEAVLEELLFWLSGEFADRPLDGIGVALAVLALATAMAFALATTLDVLQADDATATAIGVEVARARVFVLTVAAGLAAVAVTLAGPVAFIGLVAPHLARLTSARSTGSVIALSMLWGCFLALWADIGARYILYPSEAPITAVMALVGVPLLIVLLRRRRIAV